MSQDRCMLVVYRNNAENGTVEMLKTKAPTLRELLPLMLDQLYGSELVHKVELLTL